MSNRMFHPLGNELIRTICALVAAALILPALAYAGTGKEKAGIGQNKGNLRSQDDRDKDDGNSFAQKDHRKVPAVPEANTGLVLLPIAGAILLFSWRQLVRAQGINPRPV
jgi:hypothetical protein